MSNQPFLNPSRSHTVNPISIVFCWNQSEITTVASQTFCNFCFTNDTIFYNTTFNLKKQKISILTLLKSSFVERTSQILQVRIGMVSLCSGIGQSIRENRQLLKFLTKQCIQIFSIVWQNGTYCIFEQTSLISTSSYVQAMYGYTFCHL